MCAHERNESSSALRLNAAGSLVQTQINTASIIAEPLLILQAANQAKVLGRDVRLEWLEHQVQDQVTANAVGAPDAK